MQVSCDISVGNEAAKRHVRLFRALARGDGRLARVVRLVRAWARRRRLLGRRPAVSNTRARARAHTRADEGRGGLSSFGWLLLCVRFLQGFPAAPSASPQDAQRQGALPVLTAELVRELEAADVSAMQGPLPCDTPSPTGERHRAMRGEASGSMPDDDTVQEGVACSAGGEAALQGDAELLLDFFIFYGRLRPLLALPPAHAAPCSEPSSSALPWACAGTHARLLSAQQDHDCQETIRVSNDLESHASSARATAPPQTLNARPSETPVVISLLDRDLPLGQALHAAGAIACEAALWIQDPVDVGYNVARGLTPAFLLRLQCEIVRAMLVLAGPDSPPCCERAAAL